MRIACLGNMNNIIAPTAQYLADMGHEVDLFLLYEYDHFHPEADYFDKEEIKFRTIKLGWDFDNIAGISNAEIKSKIGGYDFYIGTDYAPAIMAKVGWKIDVFAWAGTDLFDWPFYESRYKIPHYWETYRIKTAKLQLFGIKDCYALPMSPNNQGIDDVVKKIGTTARVYSALPFLNYKLLKDDYFDKSKFTKYIQDLKAENDLVIIQHSRQWWKTAPFDLNKGNDRFIKGIDLFHRENPEVKLKIILLEYGTDIDESKQLIKDLGLQDLFIWIPKSLRKDLLGLIHYADIGVGETGDESWFLYCVSAEILASGIPFLGYRNDSLYQSLPAGTSTILNANSPDGIASRLTEFINNKEYWKKVAEENMSWLLKYNESIPLEEVIIDLFKDRRRKMSFLILLKLFLLEAKLKCFRLLNRAVLVIGSQKLKNLILGEKTLMNI